MKRAEETLIAGAPMGNLEGAAPGVPRSWLWLQTLLERPATRRWRPAVSCKAQASVGKTAASGTKTLAGKQSKLQLLLVALAGIGDR